MRDTYMVPDLYKAAVLGEFGHFEQRVKEIRKALAPREPADTALGRLGARLGQWVGANERKTCLWDVLSSTPRLCEPRRARYAKTVFETLGELAPPKLAVECLIAAALHGNAELAEFLLPRLAPELRIEATEQAAREAASESHGDLSRALGAQALAWREQEMLGSDIGTAPPARRAPRL